MTPNIITVTTKPGTCTLFWDTSAKFIPAKYHSLRTVVALAFNLHLFLKNKYSIHLFHWCRLSTVMLEKCLVWSLTILVSARLAEVG